MARNRTAKTVADFGDKAKYYVYMASQQQKIRDAAAEKMEDYLRKAEDERRKIEMEARLTPELKKAARKAISDLSVFLGFMGHITQEAIDKIDPELIELGVIPPELLDLDRRVDSHGNVIDNEDESADGDE